MKRVVQKLICLLLSLFVFVIVYLVLCYLPSLRIKLFAPPMEYFIESIRHMMLFKIVISVTVGLLAAGIPCIISKFARK